MSAITTLNPKAEIARAQQALAINISAAKGIDEVLQSNFGPKGTMKMLVSGSGSLKITKDGNILLHEMQIQHPTASLIARASTAQDDIIGDGTTSIVLLIGELLRVSERLLFEGLHPRVIIEGFDVAHQCALKKLNEMKQACFDEDVLLQVAETSLNTKLPWAAAANLSQICKNAIDALNKNQLDLHMVEIIEMQHRTRRETSLIHGLVLDHGGRHPDMPKELRNCFILTCNVSLEFEKTEVNSGFFYKTAESREKFLNSERRIIKERIQNVLSLKKSLEKDGKVDLLIVNQKGIDPLALDALAREGILALRRAKRRNMERLTLACGGIAVNSFDDLTPSCLGYAGRVYEKSVGEEKFTFVEDCKHPASVTIILKAPNYHSLAQTKDAVRDGLRAVANAIEDGYVIPGAGSFELEAFKDIEKEALKMDGKIVLGMKAFAEALLNLPKTLIRNSGHDVQEVLFKVLNCSGDNTDVKGIDVTSGGVILPHKKGIYDNYCVKKQILSSSLVIATNLLLVDEMMKAGLSSLKQT